MPYTKDEADKLVEYYAEKMIGKNIGEGIKAIVKKLVIDKVNDSYTVTVVALHDFQFGGPASRDIQSAAAALGLPSPQDVLFGQG